MNKTTKSIIFSILLIVLIVGFLYFYEFYLSLPERSPAILVLLLVFSVLLLAAPFLYKGGKKKRKPRGKKTIPEIKLKPEVLDVRPLVQKCRKCGFELARCMNRCPVCGTERFGYIKPGKIN